MAANTKLSNLPAPSVLFALLPGPTRKREPSAYCYRLTYRNPLPGEPGCALLWEVSGGRLTYQIALEREETGRLRWHCTCADAVYRGETVENHRCKHVRGLIDLGRRNTDDASPTSAGEAA
jgi:hypothetical protein